MVSFLLVVWAIIRMGDLAVRGGGHHLDNVFFVT